MRQLSLPYISTYMGNTNHSVFRRDPMKALMYHSAHGNVMGIKRAIFAGAGVNEGYEIGIHDRYRLVGPHDNRSTGLYKPLQLAIGNEHIEAVKYLLEQGANARTELRPGFTPFWLATSTKSVALMRLLHSYSNDVDSRNDQGLTLLHVWSQKGDRKIVECLVDLGADIHAVAQHDTALGIAARHGRIDICRFLIEKQSDINHQGNDNETPLHAAVKKGDETLVKYFTEQGANVNLLDSEGNTPLLLAAAYRHTGMVRLLHKNNADINSENHSHTTALHMAAISTNLELIQYLINNGADAHKENNDGENAIGLATRAMEYIARAPDPEAEVYEAPIEEYSEAVKIFEALRQYGSNINHKNKKGITVGQARIFAQQTWETNFPSKLGYACS